MPDDVVTRFLAVWGALLSTALGALKIREIWHDRPRLKIRVSSGMKAFPASSAYGTMTLLSISVANVGRRPTSVTHVSLLLPKGADATHVLCTDPLTATYPVELTENKGHIFVMNEDEIKARYRLKPERYVIQVDTTERSYWTHWRWVRWWKLGRTG